MAVILLFAAAARAGAPPAPGAGNSAEPIRIKADNLVAYNDANYAEFTGNVSAIQGTTLITSDKLRVYYNAQKLPASTAAPANNVTSQGGASPKAGGESIKKVVATGNVVIHFEDKVAYTPEAQYDPTSKIIVLTGADSKVISGKSYVVGEKITLLAKDNKVLVERSKTKQVEAVFYSGQMEQKP